MMVARRRKWMEICLTILLRFWNPFYFAVPTS